MTKHRIYIDKTSANKMLNLNKHTITKLKPKLKPTVNYKNCSYVCAYHWVQLPYTT